MPSLSKMFTVLKTHSMKLNLNKYAFGLRADTFLGFMISKKGIEVNPKKIQAIMEMPLLRTIKEIQRLTSKVVALNKFISRMTDNFLWIEEC